MAFFQGSKVRIYKYQLLTKQARGFLRPSYQDVYIQRGILPDLTVWRLKVVGIFWHMDVCWFFKQVCAHELSPYLHGAVVLARRGAAHVAGVAAARAALHLHARRPDEEVGGRGVHLAPGNLVDDSPSLAQRRDRLLHWGAKERERERVEPSQEFALTAKLKISRNDLVQLRCSEVMHRLAKGSEYPPLWKFIRDI